MANNRVCLCCGNAYEYCGSCRNGVNLPAWKNLFDNENCKDVFQTVSDYEQKSIDKTKAKKILDSCDLKHTFKSNIVKLVDEITKEEKREPVIRSSKKKTDTTNEKLSD